MTSLSISAKRFKTNKQTKLRSADLALEAQMGMSFARFLNRLDWSLIVGGRARAGYKTLLGFSEVQM